MNEAAVNPKWYETFFQGIALELWRKALSPADTLREIDFLEQHLQLRSGQRVLDVPSGLGRHSVELAARGYRVTGVDVSPQMIEAGNAAAQRAGVTVEWHRADMQDLAWQARFDAAFCFGNSFGYLDRSGTRTFLRAISRALVSGARFAFDYGMAAECILPRFREREWAQIDDILFLEENRYRVQESCIETTYMFMREGTAETRTGMHWVYTLGEIRELLRDADLDAVAVFGSIAGAPFEIGSPVLIVTAQKK